MDSAEFSWSSRLLGKLLVDHAHIQARGNLYSPWLILPFHVSLEPVRDDDPRGFSLLQLGGRLFVKDGVQDVDLAQFTTDPIRLASSSQGTNTNVNARISLTKAQIEYIEKVRRGEDLTLSIDFWGWIWVNNRSGSAKDSLDSVTFGMPLTIQQSHWVKKILPAWGYGRMDLLEIGLGEQRADFAKRVYDDIKRADDHFARGSDRETLSAIYEGFEALAKDEQFQKPDLNFFDKLLSDLGFESQKRQKLKHLLRYHCDFLHLGRHQVGTPSVPVEHRDARFALMSAKLILAYLSTYKSEPTP